MHSHHPRHPVRAAARLAAGILVAAPLVGCVAYEYGNSMLVQLESDQPKFDLYWDEDLGPGSEELRLVVDTTNWNESVIVGGLLVEAGASLEVVVELPFEATKKVLGVDDAGVETELEIDPYTTTPQPMYQGFALAGEYSPETGGIWLHVVVGAEAKSGFRLLIEPAS